MIKILLLLACSAPLFAQCGTLAMNPVTGKLDCVGSGVAAAATAASTVIDPSGASCTTAGALAFYTTPTPKELWVCDGSAYRFVMTTDLVGAGSITFTVGTVPTSPAPGAMSLWINTADNLLYSVNSSGVTRSIDTPRALGCTFDGGGSTITNNSICYLRVRSACTLSTSYSIVAVGSSPTATVDVFKIGTGTLLPFTTNIASSTPALSTGNAVVGTTAWTSTAVAADDMVAFKVTAVANATWLSINLRCL